MSEQHANYRDEQFWFTAAVVAFNTLLIGKDALCIPTSARIVASSVISVAGGIIILTRWVAAARKHADEVRADQQKKGITSPARATGRFRHFPAEAPNPEFSSACERFRYFLAELRTGVQSLFYISAEGSGSFFYLLLIGLTFVAVILYA